MDSGYYKTTCVDQSPRQAKAGRLEHTIKKVVDTVNTIPTHKMSDLNERDPAGAANEWHNLPGNQPNNTKVQRDIMNLITARYSQVDPIHYSTILGGGQANAGQLEGVIKKSVDTITSNWNGTPSWLQAFVKGETCCSDYQVIINNLHRMSKLLKLIPEGETPKNRALRLTRREAYKKALRAHQEHVRLGVEAEIQTAEDAIEDLSTKDGVTQVELKGARHELASLRGHREGIIPTTCSTSQFSSDTGTAAPPQPLAAPFAKRTRKRSELPWAQPPRSGTRARWRPRSTRNCPGAQRRCHPCQIRRRRTA